MGAIIINSNDSVFLNSIVELVKRFKGAKVQYIEESEELNDKEYLFDINPDLLSDEEAEYVANTYLKEAENEEGYTIEEAKELTSKFIAEWEKKQKLIKEQ